MPMINAADSTSLFVSDWGDPTRQPVLLVHAWGLNGDMWSAQVPELAEAGFRPVTYDQRGHGRSGRTPAGYGLDDLADDLAAVICDLELRGLILVGHSMGAQTVIRYLTRHGSERVAGIVLSAPAAPMLLLADDNPGGGTESVFATQRQAMTTDIGAFADATPAADYFGSASRVSPALADWTRRQIIDTPLRVLTETHKAFTRADLRTELATITLPTLILHGSEDKSTPLPMTGKPTAALIPGSRLVVFDGFGHGLYTSVAPRYNAEIISFARSVSLK